VHVFFKWTPNALRALIGREEKSLKVAFERWEKKTIVSEVGRKRVPVWWAGVSKCTSAVCSQSDTREVHVTMVSWSQVVATRNARDGCSQWIVRYPLCARHGASVPIKLLHSSQLSRYTTASTLRCTSAADRTLTSSQHLRSAGICCRWSDDVQRSARWSTRSRMHSAQQPSDNHWRRIFSLPISTFSALGVSHIMHYINARYLLNYLFISGSHVVQLPEHLNADSERNPYDVQPVYSSLGL